MKAFGSNVICKPAAAPTETAGGIILPGSMKSEYKCRAFIVKVGPEVEGLKVDDEIIFTTGNKFTVNRKEYIVVATKDILVII